MSEQIYHRLAQHLDKMPGGFPATEDDLEIRILRRLFTLEQADLAVHLNLIPEPAPVVARRAGISTSEAQQLLTEMAEKGLIYDIHTPGENTFYMGYQFGFGIWAFQVNRLDLELIAVVDEYMERDLFDPQTWKENPQLRTIPVYESIPNTAEILPYEHAEELINSHTKFAVADCICRKEKSMTGEGCDKPLETCLVMGGGADYYQRHSMGREISKPEAFEILELANEHALVMQPANTKDAGNICFCCGDCCRVLRNIKQYPQPGTLVSSPYLAVVDSEVCSACETCLDRCQMEAIEVNGYAKILDERCIGCGLCVTTCETGALRLERKSTEDLPYVPEYA